MEKMSVGKFKSNFSEVLKDGKEVAVTYGKKKEVIGYFVPKVDRNVGKRKLGILDGKAKTIFNDDFKITDEEFLGLK